MHNNIWKTAVCYRFANLGRAPSVQNMAITWEDPESNPGRKHMVKLSTLLISVPYWFYQGINYRSSVSFLLVACVMTWLSHISSRATMDCCGSLFTSDGSCLQQPHMYGCQPNSNCCQFWFTLNSALVAPLPADTHTCVCVCVCVCVCARARINLCTGC